jgi:hypothetical protein
VHLPKKDSHQSAQHAESDSKPAIIT